ncbi:helix-turn-helix domain-containing protein [Nocardia tengchongensis]
MSNAHSAGRRCSTSRTGDDPRLRPPPNRRSDLAQIADRTGYTSPNAFAAAFRRHHGQPPGRWRRTELAEPSAPIHGT